MRLREGKFGPAQSENRDDNNTMELLQHAQEAAHRAAEHLVENGGEVDGDLSHIAQMWAEAVEARGGAAEA